MSIEWQRLCAQEDFQLQAGGIVVEFASGRQHAVSVADEDDAFRLRGVVAKPRVLKDIIDPAIRAWRRNRATQLVGFRMDQRGRLVGEAWVPKVGLTADEFQLYVRAVAFECDRFEYLLTGEDRE